jgi:uncharacterized repeat protein (TIGR01451 family)
VTPGEALTYTINALHTGREPLRDIMITDVLPPGVVFVPQSATNFEYSAKEQALRWRLAELQPGAIVTGSFQVRVQGLRMGEAITNTLTATSPQADGVARTGAVVTIVPPAAERIAATAAEGGWLRAANGRLEVKIPPGAVTGQQIIAYEPLPASSALPDFVRFAFRLTAADEAGRPTTRFQAPLTLLYPYDEHELGYEKATGLAFYHLNETTGAWDRLPTTVDAIQRTLTAATDDFGVFAVGATATAGPDYQFDPGPRIKGARPQLFSGSISYSYDFELPPGRGGLTPALGLGYSSARHQRETGHYNFAGHGWDIRGENYVAKADPVNPESSALTIVLNGATYTINTSNPWFVKENPFIQTWEYVTPCVTGINGACPAWLGTTNFPYYRLRIRTSDGMRYTFQGMAWVSSAAPITAGEPPMIYRWRDNTCNPGTGAWPDLVRMPLVEVLDPSGNKIVYNWEATASNTQGRHGADDAWPEDHGCNYVRTIRLTEILYNYANDAPQVRIQLRYDAGQPAANLRWDRPHYFPVNNPSLFALYKLLGVDVKVVDGNNVLQTVRQYDVAYHDQCEGGCGDKAATLLLPKEIKEATPATSATPLVTTFSYDANKLIATQCDYGYLTTITGPYGGQISFAATKQAVNCTAPRPPTITTHIVKDIVTDQQWTWDYATVDWNEDAHGYAQVNVLAPDLGDGTRRLEQHYFHTMTSLGSASIDHLAGREYRSVACLPQSASPAAACATELQRTETSWFHSTADLPLDPAYIYLPAEQQPRFVYAQLIDTYAAGQRLLRTQDYYQTWRQGSSGKQYGNLTERREMTATTTGWVFPPARTRYSYYYPTTVYWILNKVAQALVYQGCAGCGGEVFAGASVYYYDGATSPTASPTLGRLTQQTDGTPAGGETFTQYDYYANGNLRQVRDAAGSVTETFYDSRFQAYPVCVKNAKSQFTRPRYYGVPGSAEAGCTTAAGDAAWNGATPVDGRFFGLLQDETDANNAVTTYRWDTQGRIARVIRPGDDDTNPTLRFSYTAYGGPSQPFWIKQEARDNAPSAAAAYLETRTFYDGLGQVIQTQTEGANSGQNRIISTQYNAEGQTLKQNLPYFYSGLTTYVTPDWVKPTTQTTYDALGRTKKVTPPDVNMASELYYAVDANPADPDFAAPAPSVYRIDANGHFVRQAFDAFGRLRTVTEFLASWGAPYAGEYRTRYTYDTQGHLTQVRDTAGNLTTITYDLLGRKLTLNDPDMGAWSYGYDIVSNLARQTDSRGQTICFFYDELKRLTAKSYQTTTICPAFPPTSPAVSYTYDNTASGNKGIGRRTGMATNGAGANSVAWIYDARGRAITETRTVDGVSYTTDTSYDSADRAAGLTYPANASDVRESLSYTYDAAGQLTQARSNTYSTNYASGLSYTALGQLNAITYGNAVQERRGYYGLGGDWDSRAGSGLKFFGKLFRSRAQTSAGIPRFDQRYLYDNAGNLIRLQEAATVSGSWPTSYAFQDSFDSQNTAAWTWSSYQIVPFNDGGNNVVKSAGTGTNWNSTFYRTATLSSGQGLAVRFKVDNTNPMTVLAVETADGSKRFGIYALSGKATVQYNDGSGWRYPADLIPTLQANTWYVLRIVLDDARGFYMEAYPENTPSLRASYQQWLPTGQAWRFRQWSRNGSVYLDDYREFSASSLTWNNDERLNFGYDLLNRLTAVTPDSGAQGYSQTYQYNAIGNLTYRSDVGNYTYPPSGSGSIRPPAPPTARRMTPTATCSPAPRTA